MLSMAEDQWPALPYEEWKDTYATLHMWTQVVGKVALALAPPMNHSWGIAFLVTPRGLATRSLQYGARSLTVDFEFIDHCILICVSCGPRSLCALDGATVAVSP